MTQRQKVSNFVVFSFEMLILASFKHPKLKITRKSDENWTSKLQKRLMPGLKLLWGVPKFGTMSQKYLFFMMQKKTSSVSQGLILE